MIRSFQRAFLAFATLCVLSASAGATTMPDAAVNPPLAKAGASEQSIVLAGGCFWGVEGVFQHLKGVKNVISGYAGGEAGTAKYGEVSTGTTGHAEAVKVIYDPSQVTLGEILKVYFFEAHNPTELNQQGPDHGTQYRSNIFYSTPEQKDVAEAYIRQLDSAKVFDTKIVTRLDPLKAFYPAEDYHQDFMKKNPMHPYILFHDVKKVASFKKDLPALYQE
ncbi:MAG: methionine sulfoxide reductase [Micavibrio sp.]|nr:methionine sulfoxide reductase [Micavibrio sp.]